MTIGSRGPLARRRPSGQSDRWTRDRSAALQTRPRRAVRRGPRVRDPITDASSNNAQHFVADGMTHLDHSHSFEPSMSDPEEGASGSLCDELPPVLRSSEAVKAARLSQPVNGSLSASRLVARPMRARISTRAANSAVRATIREHPLVVTGQRPPCCGPLADDRSRECEQTQSQQPALHHRPAPGSVCREQRRSHEPSSA